MSKKLICRILAVVLIVCIAFAFTGCGEKRSGDSDKAGSSDSVDNNSSNNKDADNEQKAESNLERIKKAGKLVVGTSADYPPYEFHKIIDGKDQIIGFDIAIVNEIAKELGVKLEIKDMNFDSLLGALETSNVDMVIAGMDPTPERDKSVDFSKIYYRAEQALVIRVEDKDKFKSLDDFKKAKITTQQGTIQEEMAKKHFPEATLKTLKKAGDVILDLKAKKCDVVIMEVPVAKAFVKKNSDIMISELKLEQPEGGSAIAVPEGAKDLVDAINAVLDKLIAEGKIDEFVAEAVLLSEEE